MNHSRAIASNVFSTLSMMAAFSALRRSLGSMLAATCLRTSSSRSRASFKPTSGYTPREIRFSLPPIRYLNRQPRAPEGETSGYRSRPSNILYGLARGFACSTYSFVNDIGGNSLSETPLWGQSRPKCPQVGRAVNVWPVSGLSH